MRNLLDKVQRARANLLMFESDKLSCKTIESAVSKLRFYLDGDGYLPFIGRMVWKIFNFIMLVITGRTIHYFYLDNISFYQNCNQ